ncbi:MAG: hypothetical protein ABIA74_02745 [bacterium]
MKITSDFYLSSLTQKKFNFAFRWNVFGSIAFESLKIFYHIFLIKILTSNQFGLMGAIYSIAYFSIYFSDFAATTSLPPFLSYLTESKNNFKKLFTFYFFPQIPLLILAAIIATFFYQKSIFYQPTSPFLLTLPLLIFIEGIRIFFRTFLHYIFYSRQVIIYETIFTVLYYLLILFLYFFNFQITLNTIFIPFLINSAIAVFTFILFVFQFYNTLPELEEKLPSKIYKRILKTRLFAFPNQIIKTFFTGNFLTPIFAMRIGIPQAGILKFASLIADSAKAVIKAAISFSGNALLATTKKSTLEIKKEVFNLLSRKLNNLMYCILIFLIINYKNLLGLKVSLDHVAQTAISFSFVFLMIVLAEHFFIVYEQFYTLEEKPQKFLFFKLFEFALFYLFVLTKSTTPIITLLSIIFIQVLSFLILSIHAHYKWKIKPTFKSRPLYILFDVVIALIFWTVLKII